MISDVLQKARDFEAQYGPHIPDSERPAFHATPMGSSARRPGPGSGL